MVGSCHRLDRAGEVCRGVILNVHAVVDALDVAEFCPPDITLDGGEDDHRAALYLEGASWAGKGPTIEAP
jgi:hypothetical protein